MLTKTGLKPCTKCGEEKLITQFHFLNGRDKGQPGEERRRRSDCKDCHNESMRAYRHNQVADMGETYLAAERERVASYNRENPRADARKALNRARHTALQDLRARHRAEYEALEAERKRAEGLA